jgi:hypothetical protein
MVYIISGLIICLTSSLYMGYGKQPVWGVIGLMIGGYLIIKGRDKTGLSK